MKLAARHIFSPAHRIAGLPLMLALLIGGCDGPQSALGPAGAEAEDVATLFWVMLAGGALVWCIVIGAAIIGVLKGPGRNPTRTANLVIIGGGVIFPTTVLAVLISVSVGLLPDWAESNTPLKVHVEGEQFWWRVAYENAGRTALVPSANEVHLPAGQPVEFILTSTDVIHSFWMPNIGGKMDMIPGRTNRLRLTAERPGIYRGVCTEFCGKSHALMGFAVVVHEEEAFHDWIEAHAQPAQVADSPGRALFLQAGCGSCHQVRGVVELGAVGPDLTHFGSRATLGAGMLDNTRENLIRWIADPDALKPGVQMPAYDALPEEDIAAIADFLLSLK